MKNKLNKKPLFYLSLVLTFFVVFQVVQFAQAQQNQGAYFIPPGAPAMGEFYQSLDTSNLPQKKEGILYFGTNFLNSDQLSLIRKELPFGGVVLGSGGKLCVQQDGVGWNCSLTFGGGHWMKNNETGSIYYSEGKVGIGTSNVPSGVLNVEGAGDVFFRTGTTKIGDQNNGSLLNVYSNFNIMRVHNDSPTGYVYRKVSFDNTKYSKDYNPNNFSEWQEAFPQKFAGKSWDAIRISYARTDNDCDDSSMIERNCIASKYKATASSPEYVYDIFVYESGDLFSLAFNEFKKELTGFSGGRLSAENAVVISRVGVGTNIPRTKMDINGELRVGSSGESCTNSNSGAIRFENRKFYVCDGDDWRLINAEKETQESVPRLVTRNKLVLGVTVGGDVFVLGNHDGDRDDCKGPDPLIEQGRPRRYQDPTYCFYNIEPGENIFLFAAPIEGYKFYRWWNRPGTACHEREDIECSFNISRNEYITAIFIEEDSGGTGDRGEGIDPIDIIGPVLPPIYTE